MTEDKKKNTKLTKKKIIKVMAGVFVGALLGFLYYKFFGCNSGCTISSNPYISTVYGSVSGFVITIV